MGKKSIIFAFILIIILFISSIGICQEEPLEQIDDLTLYYFTSDKTITLGWIDTNNDTISYYSNFYLLNKEKNIKELEKSNINPTTEDPKKYEYTIKVPYTGHFIVYVQICRSDTNECSDWVDSTNKDNSSVKLKVNNEVINKGWWLYGYIAPPTEPSITFEEQ